MSSSQSLINQDVIEHDLTEEDDESGCDSHGTVVGLSLKVHFSKNTSDPRDLNSVRCRNQRK